MSWRTVGRRFFFATLVAFSVIPATQSATAKVAEAVCNQIRDQAEKADTRWFAIGRTEKPTPLKSNGEYSQKTIAKIIFLHQRDDGNGQPTIMAAKLIFSTRDDYLDKDWVRAQNNFKRKPVSVSYADYNEYENGTKENFDLLANFHLTKGLNIPFSTHIAELRRQMALPPNGAGEERTYRAYLQNFEAISPRGSCMDFTPNFPSATWQTTLEVIDLLPTEADTFYRDSITFKVSK